MTMLSLTRKTIQYFQITVVTRVAPTLEHPQVILILQSFYHTEKNRDEQHIHLVI